MYMGVGSDVTTNINVSSVQKCCFVFGKPQLHLLAHRLDNVMELFCGFPQTIQLTAGTVPQIRPRLLPSTASSIFHSPMTIQSHLMSSIIQTNQQRKLLVTLLSLYAHTLTVCSTNYGKKSWLQLRHYTTTFEGPCTASQNHIMELIFPFQRIVNHSALANDVQCYSKL